MNIKKLTGVFVVAGAVCTGASVNTANALPDISGTFSSTNAISIFGASAGFSGAPGNRYSCSSTEYTIGFGSGASGSGFAQTLRYSGFAYNGAYGLCGDSQHTANTSGTVVTAQATLRAVTTQTNRLIANRISNINAAGGIAGLNKGGPKLAGSFQDGQFEASSGVSSGDFGGKLGVWASGTWTTLQDSNVATQFDGHAYTVLVGADYQVTDRIVLGLSGGYDKVDLDTGFNGNIATGQDGEVEGDGYIVAPYASYKIDDIFSVKLSGGYTWVDYDSVRFDPGDDSRITGDTDGTRYFVDVGGTAAKSIDEWRLRGNASYMYAREEKDAYTESNGNSVNDSDSGLSQLRFGTELGYVWNVFEPYAKVGVEYDLSKDGIVTSSNQVTASDDDFGVVLGGGVKVFAAPNITGFIEGTSLEAKDDYNEYTVQGSLRVNF